MLTFTERTWSSRSLRNLEGIHPDLRRVLDRALTLSPLDFIVIEGLRTEERQRELVASGASKTMRSRHLTGHAIDILPIGPSGPRFDWPLYHKIAPAFKQAAKIENVDLEWGGDWESFKDGPHFQLSWAAYPPEAWSSDKKPKDRTLVQSRTIQGAAITGAAEAGRIALDAAKEFEPLAVASPVIPYILSALTVIGVGLVIYARLDDWRNGHKG